MKLKKTIAVLSFISAIIIGFIALYLPPTGIIDTSVLWFIAQLLVFTSNIFGFNLNVSESNQIIQSIKKD